MKTISLPLAKQLYKLGVKGNGRFYVDESGNLIDSTRFIINRPGKKRRTGVDLWHAYTLDEVLDLLPKTILVPERLELCQNETYERTLSPWYIGYYAEDQGGGWDTLEGSEFDVIDNPAEAAGNLLAWVVEEGYYKTATSPLEETYNNAEEDKAWEHLNDEQDT